MNASPTAFAPSRVSAHSGSFGIWKKKMYHDLRSCLHRRSSRWAHVGCGTFMITSRSSGRTVRIANIHACTAPQSWATSVTRS
ncbi:MAG: hypothetical protein R2697_18640 [Ilumatobacteraceae bacterium]